MIFFFDLWFFHFLWGFELCWCYLCNGLQCVYCFVVDESIKCNNFFVRFFFLTGHINIHRRTYHFAFNSFSVFIYLSVELFQNGLFVEEETTV